MGLIIGIELSSMISYQRHMSCGTNTIHMQKCEYLRCKREINTRGEIRDYLDKPLGEFQQRSQVRAKWLPYERVGSKIIIIVNQKNYGRATATLPVSRWGGSDHHRYDVWRANQRARSKARPGQKSSQGGKKVRWDPSWWSHRRSPGPKQSEAKDASGISPMRIE